MVVWRCCAPAGVISGARVAPFGNGWVDKVWRSSVGTLVMAVSPLPSRNDVWKRPEMVWPSARSSGSWHRRIPAQKRLGKGSPGVPDQGQGWEDRRGDAGSPVGINFYGNLAAVLQL
jgi:hypothetical protein